MWTLTVGLLASHGFPTAAMAAPSASSQSLSKHGSSSILAAQQQLQHPIPKPGGPAPPPRKVLDDPFALFEEVPGAAPPQKHLIQPTPPVIGNVNTLLDFDDGHGTQTCELHGLNEDCHTPSAPSDFADHLRQIGVKTVEWLIAYLRKTTHSTRMGK